MGIPGIVPVPGGAPSCPRCARDGKTGKLLPVFPGQGTITCQLGHAFDSMEQIRTEMREIGLLANPNAPPNSPSATIVEDAQWNMKVEMAKSVLGHGCLILSESRVRQLQQLLGSIISTPESLTEAVMASVSSGAPDKFEESNYPIPGARFGVEPSAGYEMEMGREMGKLEAKVEMRLESIQKEMNANLANIAALLSRQPKAESRVKEDEPRILAEE